MLVLRATPSLPPQGRTGHDDLDGTGTEDGMLSARNRLRGGGGLLIAMALCAVAILLVLLFHQSRMSSWVSMETDALIRGERAEMVADSAVEEAMAQIRLHVNEEGSALFKEMRTLLYHPDKGKLDLSPRIDLPETRLLLAETSLKGYGLDFLTAKVVLQKQLDGTPYERNGIIRYEALARAPGGSRSVTRRVEAVQSFRLVLTCVPQPFSSYGFFLADVGLLTDLPAINRQRDELLFATRQLWEWIREAKGPAPLSLGKLYDVLEDGVVAQDTARNAKPVVEAERAAFYGLPIAGVKMDLALLDLSTDLQKILTRAREREGRVVAALAAIRRDASDENAHEDFVEEAHHYGRELEEGLLAIWAFRRAFRILPSEHEAYKPLQASFWKLSTAFWKRRVQWRVRPREGEPLEQAWKRFLEDHPRPRGVILIDNPSTPFHLTGSFSGDVVLLFGAGGLRVDDFNTAESGDPEASVTLVCPAGPVTISGEVHGAFVFPSRKDSDDAVRLEIRPGTVIQGGFYARDLPITAGLRGTLLRDEKFYSGQVTPKGQVVLDDGRIFVGLSPSLLYRKVHRS